MQETSFPFELVIGDDCSTDSTRDIVVDYANKYPEKTRPLLHEANLGLSGKNNFIKTLQSCRGQYIALCEGDDYWTAPDKLKRQVDFLENFPDHSVCFTRTRVFFEDNSYPSYEIPELDGQIHSLTLEELLRDNFIANCSVMFRRGLFAEFPNWYFDLLLGDWPLHILNAQHGKVGYVPEVMAAYRMHAGGIWSTRKLLDNLFEEAKFYKFVDKHLNFEYHDLIREMLAHKYQRIALEYLRRKDFAHARCYSIRSLNSLPLSQFMTSRFFIKKSLSILKHSF